ncbi:MAG: ribbon-helix-helix domain-containing protein [Candidatus Methanosuratincola petrocarbonis]
MKMLKTYAAKLEEGQIEALKKLSRETKIPQAELLRQAVDLLLRKWKADQERLEFIRRLDGRLEEDREAMERLAEL